jgi:membrane fusion protein, macrolide-specific efflux system
MAEGATDKDTPEVPAVSDKPAARPRPGKRPQRRKARKPWVAGAFLAVLVIAAIAFAVWAVRGTQTKAATYATAQATKDTLVVTVSASGNMVVNDQKSVTPQVSGTVSHLYVSLGDKVKSGQTLYTIDNPDLATAVTRAKGAWRQAQASRDRAEISLAQAQQSRDQLDSKPTSPTETDIEIADEQVSAAERGLQAACDDLSAAYDAYQLAQDDYAARTVTAPITGVVSLISLTEGGTTVGSSSSGGSSSGGSSSSNSNSSSSGSLVISNLTTLRARVAVNEVDMPSVKVGQKASLTFDAIGGLTLAGKVVKVALTGTNSSGVVTYDVDIVPISLDSRIRPNMTCSAAITTNVRPDVVLVPNTAVKSDTNGDYVQVLGSDGTPQRVDVVVGASNDSYTEIKSGVTAGQNVVTTSASSSSSSSSSRSGFGGGGGARFLFGGGN